MGDSDDDYNSHNNSGNLGHNGNNNGMSGNNSYNNSNNKKNNSRAKFYRERDDSNNSGYGNSRRDWSNGDRNNSRGGDSYKNNYVGNNRQYGGYGNQSGNPGSNYNRGSDYPRKYSNQSPTSGGHGDTSPPPYKRNRRDYEDSGRSYGGDCPSPHGGHQSRGHQSNESDFPTQPPFLSFKMFLQQQNDDISDEDAIKKYNDYKMDFKKTQINNFFLEHKEEDWFKLRYHPDENFKRRNEQNQFILNRLEIFMELMNKGWLENVSSEFDKSKEIVKFLDAVVIKLEGGSDEDLKVLDEVPASDEPNDAEKDTKEKEDAKEKENGEDDGEIDDTNEDSNEKPKKRKSEDSGSESGAYTESENEDSETRKKKSSRKNNSEKLKDPKNLNKTTSIFMRNLAPSVTKQDLENLCKDYEGFKRVAISDPAPERGFFRRGWITFESNVDVKKICWNLQNTKIKDFNPGAIVNRELTNRIRPITSLNSHHKAVVKNDIKTAMKIIQNMDNRWKLWVEEGDESLVDNEDEDQEGSKDNAAMDTEGDETAKLEKMAFSSVKSTEPKYLKHKFLGPNPLFENITDYIVDEIDAEEQELLGDSANTPSKTNSSAMDIEIDQSYNAVLDRLILYLRVVHSFDFYNSIEYQQEDSMPNRCGIMFVRPSVSAANLKTTSSEVSNYTKQFDTKMKPYVDYKEKLDQPTAQKLGLKDRKEEVEKFIKTNTQELAADRWLCPLSGKKFKGPEFIRKHLFYKHMDKITEVKKEVEYFNNYVFDPKRPQLPEHQTNKSGGNVSQQNSGHNANPNSQPGYPGSGYHHNSPGNMLQNNMMAQMGGYGGMQNRQMGGYGMQPGYMQDSMQHSGYGNYNPNYGGGGYQMNRGRGGYNMNRGGRGGRDSREMIQYRDLDAPDE